jgi:hypothetical protein
MPLVDGDVQDAAGVFPKPLRLFRQPSRPCVPGFQLFPQIFVHA